MKLLKRLLILGVAVVVLGAGALFVYHFFLKDEEPRLSFEARDEQASDPSDDTTATDDTSASDETIAPDATAVGVDGTWTVTTGTEAGYRATEILFGADAVAVGRTEEVTGSIDISDTSVTAGSFTVDVTTFESDQDNRDNQFRSRIMETDEFPTSTFELTGPLDFGALPADGETLTVSATGRLTLHGVTNEVTFDVEARINAGNIEIVGSIPVHFADYEIDDPSGGPAQVGEDGEVEFLLVLAHAPA